MQTQQEFAQPQNLHRFGSKRAGSKRARGEVTKLKVYNKTNIEDILFAMKGLDKNVFPIGKTAEVMRGLYDKTTGLQFLWPDADERKLSSVARQLGCRFESENHFRSNAGFGFVTGFGVIYLSAYIKTGTGANEDAVYVEEFLRGKDSLINLLLNYQWFSKGGFYDKEMMDNDEYTHVYNVISEINGDDSDVLALRTLIDFSNEGTHTSLQRLNVAMSKATNASHFEPFVLDARISAKL